MSDTKRLKKQRLAIWKYDPHCYWCGVKTILPSKHWKGPTASNVATIDHLRPRHHPGRLEPCNGREFRRVLSCFKCNNERDRIEHEMMPREKLWEMCGNYPLSTKPLDELKRIESILLAKEPKRKADRESIYRSLVAVRDAMRTKIQPTGLVK